MFQKFTSSPLQVVVDPKNLGLVLVSPRQRAHRTFHLLFEHLPELPPHILSEEVREWDYGHCSYVHTSCHLLNNKQGITMALRLQKSKRKTASGIFGRTGTALVHSNDSFSDMNQMSRGRVCQRNARSGRQCHFNGQGNILVEPRNIFTWSFLGSRTPSTVCAR